MKAKSTEQQELAESHVLSSNTRGCWLFTIHNQLVDLQILSDNCLNIFVKPQQNLDPKRYIFLGHKTQIIVQTCGSVSESHYSQNGRTRVFW